MNTDKINHNRKKHDYEHQKNVPFSKNVVNKIQVGHKELFTVKTKDPTTRSTLEGFQSL